MTMRQLAVSIAGTEEPQTLPSWNVVVTSRIMNNDPWPGA
jgi:hypothetical protein